MTTSRTGGPSRPGSSRAASVAREIIKKRDKPYRTEKYRVLTKKRKLELTTSYKQAPDGYTFVAVGTPDLSDRCKELSRQKGLPVSVVNAAPVSKQATNPEKISHHIHRIGYHFKTELVETAREELGYVYYRDHFVKETDLQAQYQQSHVARIMMEHGIAMNQSAVKETPTKVRAAIKELFPRIPDEDLDQIVEHAWKEGTQRVGTNSALELPRRVQLATIARIRHMYTDYDRLLRAFEWKDARAMVEPECLHKLIEWRGENDNHDDNELEEIVRETIVIDDDDDGQAVATYTGEADDEDSDANLGDSSDASLEFTHHLAIDEDLGAESVNESSRNFLRRFQPRPLRTEQQTSIAREKIGAARQRLRHAPPAQATNSMPLSLQSDQRGVPPTTIVVDGTTYHLAPTESAMRPAPSPHQPLRSNQPPQQQFAYGAGYPSHSTPNTFQRHPVATQTMQGHNSIDRVLPSIEPHRPVLGRDFGPASRAVAPVTPELQYPDKRRRIEQPREYARPFTSNEAGRAPQHTWGANQHRHGEAAGHEVVDFTRREIIDLTSGEVIDLTSPVRRNPPAHPSPMRDVQYRPIGPVDQDPHGQRQPGLNVSSLHGRPPLMPSWHEQSAAHPEPYDPTQPLLPLPQQQSYRPTYAASERPGQDYLVRVSHAQPPGPGFPLHDSEPYVRSTSQEVYAPSTYQTAYPDPRVKSQGLALTPQPVHGAPAPVQQVARPLPSAGSTLQRYQTPAYVQQVQHVPAPQPVNGAPHPAQYYHPR